MKKGIIILLSVLLATVFLTACGAMDSAGGRSEPGYVSESLNMQFSPSATPMPMPAPDGLMGDMVAYDDGFTVADSRVHLSSAGGMGEMDVEGITPEIPPVGEGLSEKIIYSVWAEIETRNFDDTIAKVNALIAANGAFIENSNERGINYGWSGQSYRHAYFLIRVPVSQLDSMESQLGTLGNVVSQSRNATNITSQFIDTEARRNSLLIQEERILDMLSRVEDLSDLILLEQHLSSIRYQIESLTSTLNNWQRQVDYSTLTININEVEEFTEFVPIHRSYWEQMGDGIMATLRGIGNFFTSIFMGLVVSGPVLLILIGLGLITFIIVRAKIRKYNKNKPQRPAPQYYPPAYPAAAPAPAPVAPSTPEALSTPEQESPAPPVVEEQDNQE